MSTVALLVGLLVGGLIGCLGALLLTRTRSRAAGSVTESASLAADPDVIAADDLAELHQSLLERAPIGIVALDSSDELVLINRQARDLGAIRRRRLVEPLLEVARSSRTSGEITRETTLSTGGLPPRSVSVRVVAIPLPQRVVALVVEDITDARRVDVVRRDFVANVSHEIKTPVGALRLLAEAAMESLADEGQVDQTRHFVERIAHESARLGRLVSELLDLSRLQGAERPPALAPVRLDDVVTEAIDRAAAPADAKEIDIVRGVPSGAVVMAVETQLVTAVANLLDNAINYSPEGTRVAVAVRRVGKRWEITVSDQGVGIPEADLDRIFERFYRVDPARSRATGGTGLGLAIVKHIVRNHGGDVRVWSAPGAGSSFTICVPVTDPVGPVAATDGSRNVSGGAPSDVTAEEGLMTVRTSAGLRRETP
jgi:two-component system sensor histidine kinase SenX3